jgi:hypothetical protein
LVGPAVRLLLHHYQLDGSGLAPTGPKRNLLKRYVHFTDLRTAGRV